MLFNSFIFAGFLFAVLALYLLLSRRLLLQNGLLLGASYLFYGWWDWRFLSLIVLSTLVDYGCGRALDRAPKHSATGHHDSQTLRRIRFRRAALWTSVAVNLGILCFFKYYDFFAESAAGLLAVIGLPLQPRLLELVLPVGISFYTFQTMSYTIDVYRGKIRAHRNLLEFAVFVAFFPQLVAGPICRASALLPQVATRRRLNLRQSYEGCYLILWGLFKKVVIADNLALIADRVFTAPDQWTGGAIMVAVYAFAIQIYCDFSGYTDIARGVAKLLGFELQLNFKLPYFATNPQEFWRRWHISLSSWLRDYLYVPLGGNRKGPRRTCINLMLTMILGGLWHGAAWTFALWGAYQGILLLLHRATMPWIRSRTDKLGDNGKRVASALALFAFFHATCLGWLIFRSDSVGQIGQMLAGIATPWPWWILNGANTLAGTGVYALLGFSLPLIVMQIIQHRKDDLLALLRMSAPVRGLAYAAFVYGLVIFGQTNDKPFIYFQF